MPRQAVGERRLANALPSGDQPGMVHATTGEGGGQRSFGSVLADEEARFARMGEAFEAVGLGESLALLGACACHLARSLEGPDVRPNFCRDHIALAGTIDQQA